MREKLKMKLYDKLVNKEEKLSLVGLGYVGMPIAVEFSKHVDVLGFLIDTTRQARSSILVVAILHTKIGIVLYLVDGYPHVCIRLVVGEVSLQMGMCRAVERVFPP